MAKKFYLVNDPEFSEFVFNAMFTVSQDKLYGLSHNELKNFKDKDRMRRFADNESLEKRLLLLARIGYQYNILIGQKEAYYTEDTLDKLVDQYAPGSDRLKLIEAFAQQKLFAFGSREMILYSHMAAHNSHSQLYVLNMEYVRLHNYFSELRSTVSNDLIKNAAQSFDWMAGFLLNSINATEQIDAIIGITMYQLKILLALYRYRNQYVSVPKVAGMVHESHRNKGVAKALAIMAERRWAGCSTLYMRAPVKHYMIMEDGIDIICKYIKYILNQTWFNA